MVEKSPCCPLSTTGTEPCILVFVKSPEPGRVKTRLAQKIGPVAAAELYKCFTADVLATLAAGGYPVRVWFHPPDSGDRVRRWLGGGYRFSSQSGRDLGERMARAFEHAFAAGAAQAVILGTDFPDLPVTLVHQAFEGIRGTGAVLGPALDGGYYLVGFRSDRYAPEIFKGMPWGTPRVLETTLSVLDRKGQPVHLLPRWRDIDTWEDLLAWVRDPDRPARAAPATMACLSSMETPPAGKTDGWKTKR